MNRSTVARSVSMGRPPLSGYLTTLLLDAATAKTSPVPLWHLDVDGWERIHDDNAEVHNTEHESESNGHCLNDDEVVEFPPSLNFDRVHQAMIPGVWHQVQLGTFPTNWVVLRFARDSDTQLELYAHGAGGLQAATEQLSSKHVRLVHRLIVFLFSGHHNLGPTILCDSSNLLCKNLV
jgi:hypothetical protein